MSWTFIDFSSCVLKEKIVFNCILIVLKKILFEWIKSRVNNNAAIIKETPIHVSLICIVTLHYYRAHLWLVSVYTVCQGKKTKAVKQSSYFRISIYKLWYKTHALSNCMYFGVEFCFTCIKCMFKQNMCKLIKRQTEQVCNPNVVALSTKCILPFHPRKTIRH